MKKRFLKGDDEMRLTGMASGMDINQIVDDLMKVRRMPLDKLNKQKQQVEWQRDDYREMNLKLSNFRESMRAKGLALQSSFFQKKITSSDESAVTARVVGNADNITTQIGVQRLATSSRWQTDAATNLTTEVKEATVSEWQSHSATSWDADGNAELSFSVTKPGGTAEPVSLKINKNDKLGDIINKINSSSLGVSAFYDTNQEKVVMTMKETGEGANISLTNTDGTGNTNSLNLFTDLGFDIATNTLNPVQTGVNAQITINGFATERTSNSFTVNGMEYTIRDLTTSDVSITATTDTDKIYDQVMEFVKGYNELIEAVNGELREDKYRSFLPLTSEEKKAMSENEVKLWEEKARSGMLKNSTILSKAMSGIRSDLYSMVGGANIGAFTDLSAIGLVSSKDWNDGGKIVIDPDKKTYLNGERLSGEERLRKAIEDDPEGLYKLFMADGPTPSEQGIIRRMSKTLDTAMENVAERAGKIGRQNHQFTLGRELDSINDRISDLERRMKQYEDRYFKQFNAMEKAMQRANSQAEAMFSQLNGGQM